MTGDDADLSPGMMMKPDMPEGHELYDTDFRSHECPT